MNVLITSKAIWYLMRGSGVVSLILLTGVMTLGVATSKRWQPGRMPRFVTVSLHRSIALLSVVFVAIHVTTAVLDPYAFVNVASVFLPFAAGRAALWVGLGAVSLDLVLALIVSSLVRSRLSPRLWRGIHWLAYLSWPVALAHGLGMGSDTGTVWLRAIAAACIATVGVAAVWRLRDKNSRSKRLEPRGVPRLDTAAEKLLA
jgi:methionine sulfoxide reductase heme-binding subunit